MRTKTFIITLLMFLLLTACNQSLQLKVESDVPAPLAKQYPLFVGIFFTDEFRNFVYKEDSEDRPDWVIETGLSQVQLFKQILPSMFESVKEVDSFNATSFAAVFKPEMKEIQLAIPEETKAEVYEVWLKYYIQLLDTKGTIIADWTVTGYGKSSTEFLKSKDEGLNSAFSWALRDVGAKFILNFDKNDDVKKWLAKLELCDQSNNYC